MCKTKTKLLEFSIWDRINCVELLRTGSPSSPHIPHSFPCVWVLIWERVDAVCSTAEIIRRLEQAVITLQAFTLRQRTHDSHTHTQTHACTHTHRHTLAHTHTHTHYRSTPVPDKGPHQSHIWAGSVSGIIAGYQRLLRDHGKIGQELDHHAPVTDFMLHLDLLTLLSLVNLFYRAIHCFRTTQPTCIQAKQFISPPKLNQTTKTPQAGLKISSLNHNTANNSHSENIHCHS